MSVILCANCGGTTNTAACNHLDPVRPDGKANYCYTRWANGKWEKGCGYDRMDPVYDKPGVDRLIHSDLTPMRTK